MLAELCLTAFLGYARSIETDWHKSQDLSGPYAELQTCPKGFGGRLAFGQQWVQIGPQYGHEFKINEYVSITIQAHGGLGYSNTFHPDSKVRQVTKWNGGLAVLGSYKQWHIKAGYDHMSNGRGADPTNSGQDMWTIATGYIF